MDDDTKQEEGIGGMPILTPTQARALPADAPAAWVRGVGGELFLHDPERPDRLCSFLQSEG